MSRHLPKLIEIARTELPQLHQEALGAANPYQLREVVLKLVNILTYVVQHEVLDASSTGKAPPPHPPQTAVPARPVVQQVARFAPVARPFPVVAPAADPLGLPPPPDVAAANPTHSAVANLPGDVPIQPGVANVVITASGTTAISPTGVRTTLPVGEHVPLEATLGAPPEPPPAFEADGTPNVVLPPGGGDVPPEVLAAIGSRGDPQAK